MPDDLYSRSATELVELIKTGAASSVEIVESYLLRIEQINPAINAVVTIAPDALGQARARDSERTHGKACGPLHGLPVTVKDTIDTEGIKTTYGSRLFAEHVPDRDAPVVARLKAAGAIILGKTNTPEMAIPYETDNPVFGRTNNPHNLQCTSGGSSGGDAAAIAARLSPASIGSDLSGSIRVPAHFCGVAGLKPTPGTIAMEGHVPRAAGVLALGACLGPLAAHVADLALLFSVIADRVEASSLDEAIDALPDTPVAYYTDDGVATVEDDVSDAVRVAADILQQHGLLVRADRPESITVGAGLWINLFSTAAAEQIRQIYQGREHEAGSKVAALLGFNDERTLEKRMESAKSLAQVIVKRERLREDLIRWMRNNPLLLAPVCATAAFPHGATRVDVKGKSASIFRSCSYSQVANVFGLPAVAVPIARTRNGLSLGVQLIGRPFDEQRVLAAAALIERSAAS